MYNVKEMTPPYRLSPIDTDQETTYRAELLYSINVFLFSKRRIEETAAHVARKRINIQRALWRGNDKSRRLREDADASP